MKWYHFDSWLHTSWYLIIFSRWRPVAWGLTLQFLFGLIILRWNVGVQIFQCIGEKAVTFLGYTDKGSAFVYGYLVSQTPFDTSVLPHNETYNSTGKV